MIKYGPHNTNKPASRLKVLPDRVFSRLWNAAEKADSKSSYIKEFTNPMSENYIDFNRKYEIDPEAASIMLSEIYEKSHMTFKEIITKAGKRKADISNIFCIPIRTVEEWYTGNNKCNGYIRLMLLKRFHMLSMGKYITTESDREFKESMPRTYATSKKKVKRKGPRESIYYTEPVEEYTYDNDEEEIDFGVKTHSIDNIMEQYGHIGRKPHYDDSDVKALLNKTDYLKDLMKK